MLQALEAIFDGTILQIEEPLKLKAGTRVRIIVMQNRGLTDALTADDHFNQAGLRG